MEEAQFAELKRVGVIDVGSNSVRLVVFDGAARSPAYFFNEKILCGLGRGMAETGYLHPEGRQRAFAAMKRFTALAKSFDVKSLTAVATAAVREAKDGPDFITDVFNETGVKVSVASGMEEARLSAQGVLLGWPSADGLVCDIGGASMELAELSNGKVGTRVTSALGAIKLGEYQGNTDTYIRKTLTGLKREFRRDYKNLYLVGGSFRAIAKLDMARRRYPLQVMHEYQLEQEQLADTLDWISVATLEEFRSLSSTSSERLALVPDAARVLSHLVDIFQPTNAAISAYGIREGLLYERMPQELRDRDPLIEACASMEQNASRFPGFGTVLANWVKPLVRNTKDWHRIATAAALLHDVSWRSDPSSRAEECFDNAMRGYLGAISHKGRVMLAMALLHRYRKNGKLEKYKSLKTLLSDEERVAAQVIGQAMRLGASLAGGDATVLQKAHLDQSATHLELQLDATVANFGGEVIEMRLKELAQSMEREGTIKFL